jgi:hypothetical protein
MGMIIKKLVANVTHNGQWKWGHMAWSQVCTSYTSCNIIVALVAHLQ